MGNLRFAWAGLTLIAVMAGFSNVAAAGGGSPCPECDEKKKVLEAELQKVVPSGLAHAMTLMEDTLKLDADQMLTIVRSVAHKDDPFTGFRLSIYLLKLFAETYPNQTVTGSTLNALVKSLRAAAGSRETLVDQRALDAVEQIFSQVEKVSFLVNENRDVTLKFALHGGRKTSLPLIDDQLGLNLNMADGATLQLKNAEKEEIEDLATEKARPLPFAERLSPGVNQYFDQMPNGLRSDVLESMKRKKALASLSMHLSGFDLSVISKDEDVNRWFGSNLGTIRITRAVIVPETPTEGATGKTIAPVLMEGRFNKLVIGAKALLGF